MPRLVTTAWWSVAVALADDKASLLRCNGRQRVERTTRRQRLWVLLLWCFCQHQVSNGPLCEAFLPHGFLQSPSGKIRKSPSPDATAPSFTLSQLSASSSASFSSNPTSQLSREDALKAIRQGMKCFRDGQVNESLEYFNQVYDQRVELRPYLWQRGISLYYANRFQEASNQFHLDVQVNPYDVEEIVWGIASQLKLQPQIFPPRNIMSVPSLNRDRRRIMPTVYKLFRGESTEYALFQAGHVPGSSSSDEFYSLLYLGLFGEVRGESSKAALYMKHATRTEYAILAGSADYMTAVARVHCQLRGWI